MSRRQRLVMAMIIFGTFAYILILQILLIYKGVDAEPDSPEFRKWCSNSFLRKNTYGFHETNQDKKLPMIYVVTPTYRRPEMLSELTRLGQILLLVPQIHWIVAEDTHECTDSITHLLNRLGLPYTHIASPMPENYRKLRHTPRGVSNRRAALEWIKENGSTDDILYFLDDDNTIDVRLFDHMRYTKKVSMWPVGFIGAYTVSSPVVNEEGLVTGFYDGWPAGRKFQVDMAGFAVNIGYLKKQKKVTMPYVPGHEEDRFLRSLNLTLADIEVKAKGCTDILVWHTRTQKVVVRTVNAENHKDDNIYRLLKNMKIWGMIK